MELKGIDYISTPRVSRVGGGAAIAVRLEKFSLSKLNVSIPANVEAVWGLVKPKMPSKFSAMLVCSFYSPPSLKKNVALINHITSTLQSLINIHKNAGVFICGDRNQVEISTFLNINPNLRQIVQQPTHGRKILDVMFTNLHSLYDDAHILPPLTPDSQSSGVPSDHLGALAVPRSNWFKSENKKITRHIRPLPDSLLNTFRDKFSDINFDEELKNLHVEEMVAKYQTITSKLVCSTFPEKKIHHFSNDKPWFNEELRKLRRQRMREYTKNGKSDKYYAAFHGNCCKYTT